MAITTPWETSEPYWWATDSPSNTLPTVGNGALSLSERRHEGNYLVELYLKWGSTTTLNGLTGAWSFGLSDAAAPLFTSDPLSELPRVLSAQFYDASADRFYAGAARVTRGGNIGTSELYSPPLVAIEAICFGENVPSVRAGVPVTFATDDVLLIGNAVRAFDN